MRVHEMIQIPCGVLLCAYKTSQVQALTPAWQMIKGKATVASSQMTEDLLFGCCLFLKAEMAGVRLGTF